MKICCVIRLRAQCLDSSCTLLSQYEYSYLMSEAAPRYSMIEHETTSYSCKCSLYAVLVKLHYTLFKITHYVFTCLVLAGFAVMHRAIN